MNHKFKYFKGFLLVGILIPLVAAFLGYYFVVPRCVDFDKYKSQIRSKIKEKTLYPTELGKLDIALTWDLRARVSTDKLIIKKNNEQNFIDIGSSYIEVFLPSLLQKEIAVKKLYVNTLNAEITRLEDGKFDIASILSKTKNPEYKVSLENTALHINGYNINFIEKFIQPSQNYALIGKKFTITKFTPNKYIQADAIGKFVFKDKPTTDYKIHFASKLPLSEKKKTSISGEITDFEPDNFISYINNLFSAEFVSIAKNGTIKFDIELNKKNKFSIEGIVNGLKLETKEHGLFSENKGQVKFLSNGFYTKNNILLDFLKINSKDINIKTFGEIKNYNKRRNARELNLKLRITKTSAQPLAKLFPKIVKVKRTPFKNILKHDVKALVSGKIDIKGKADNPQMFGFVDYEDFEMLGGFEDAPKSFGKINFIGPTLLLENKLYVGKNNFVNVTGSVKPFKLKDMNIDITSNEVEFARVETILFALKDFIKMKIDPVLLMDFKGKGRANLNISGKTYDVNLNGYVEGKDLTIKHEKLSMPAHNINGKIRFLGKKIHYDEISGLVEGMKVIPSGYSTLINPKTKKSYADVVIHIPQLQLKKGLKLVKNSPLLSEAKIALKDIQQISGIADTKIHLVGTPNDIKPDGELILTNANVLYKGFGGLFKRLNGSLKFDDADIYFEDISGKVKDSNIAISGFIKGNFDSQLNIKSEALNLKSAKEFLMGSYTLKEVVKILGEYTDIRGTSAINVDLNGNLNGNPLERLTFTKLDAVFNHKLIKIPVSINDGIIVITPDTVNAQNITGVAEGIKFKINGDLSNLKAYIAENKALIPEFDLEIEKFNLSKIKVISQIPLLPKKIKKLLSDFNEIQGTAKIYAKIQPENFHIKVIPENISAVYTPYNAFINISNGEAEFSDKNLKLSSIKGVLSESIFNLTGFVNNYRKSSEFDIITDINIKGNDIEKIKFHSTIPLFGEGTIPLELSLKGTKENWDVIGKIRLDKESSLNYMTDIGLPKDRVRLVTLEAKGIKDRLSINSLKLDISNPISTETSSESFQNLISVHGVIDKLKSSNPVFKNFIIKTNPQIAISTKFFNPSMKYYLNNGCNNFFSDGEFITNIELNGYVATPDINGNTTFKDITIPDYDTFIGSANLKFNGSEIYLDVNDLTLGGSNINISALIDTKLKDPLLIKNLGINSKKLNIDEIIQIFSKEKNNHKQKGGSPSFIITTGTLKANELVIKDLITTNANTKIDFTPDWLLNFSNINFAAANGKGNGNIYYNVKTNELTADFKVEKMQANPLASTLLNLKNEVYGTLTGNFRFSSRGKSQQELIANSNGFAEFTAYNGRFVRLGSLEYFLKAVNIVQCGIGGFNINNVIDLLIPKETGHFEKLNGKVVVKDGVLYTDDITSAGKNLSIYISGEMDMLTNRANIQILGKLSKKISSLLGPIGSVSINEFIDYIPGLGFLPATPGRKGVIDLIPGLSKIPVLELGNEKKDRRFAVHINGNLYKQDSVKSFRWLD